MKKMKHLNIVNIYKFNPHQIMNIMFRVKTNSIPETLQNKVIEYNYSTRYNFKEPNTFLGLLNL